jgi:trans-2,3-dihydro-3-hydroxyanthranilate isomerase
MRYRYVLCDVFTDQLFGGNPLAVLPDARGLSDRRMQQIAREFNFSESSFVFPAQAGQTKQVRIFTPSREVPFAGHPNVGTAFALAAIGELGAIDLPLAVTFEEKAGLVPIRIEKRPDGSLFCELTAPEALTVGAAVPVEDLAAAVSLTPEDVVVRSHPPRVASVGLPFLFAELRDRRALEKAHSDPAGLAVVAARGVPPDIHLRARMFAPFDGVPEDPATGSANAALAALLASLDEKSDGTLRYRIAQGVEMGRPSVLEARVDKHDGSIETTRIGGTSVLVGEGWIEVPPE